MKHKNMMFVGALNYKNSFFKGRLVMRVIKAMQRLKVFIFVIIFKGYLCNEVIREKRTLIFPPTSPTRAQLIYGIGIPLELDTESMTTGYVLKAEYFLPTNASELHPDMINPQPISKRSYHTDESFEELEDPYTHETYYRYTMQPDESNERKPIKSEFHRWALYKSIETAVDRIGLIGRVCMLRSICEAAYAPFHFRSGLLEELLHVIMTPSTSDDPLMFHSDNEYLRAEKLGKSGARCEQIFHECKKSILEVFSRVYHAIST